MDTIFDHIHHVLVFWSPLDSLLSFYNLLACKNPFAISAWIKLAKSLDVESGGSSFVSGKITPSLLVSLDSSSTGYTAIRFNESNTAVFRIFWIPVDGILEKMLLTKSSAFCCGAGISLSFINF